MRNLLILSVVNAHVLYFPVGGYMYLCSYITLPDTVYNISMWMDRSSCGELLLTGHGFGYASDLEILHR